MPGSTDKEHLSIIICGHAEKTWIAVFQLDRNARMRREQGNVEFKEETITLLSFNITSWRKQSMRAFEQKADIIALQETRISDAAKDGATRHAAANGFSAIWGKGMVLTRKHRGGRLVMQTEALCHQGGVGILAKKKRFDSLLAAGAAGKSSRIMYPCHLPVLRYRLRRSAMRQTFCDLGAAAKICFDHQPMLRACETSST